MDWENLYQLQNQKYNDSSSSSTSSGDVERETYVFRAYDLIKINYKHQNSSKYPVSRIGNRVIASESNLYCLGTCNPQSSSSASELWSYNFATNKWKLLLNSKAMPRKLDPCDLAMYHNVLISYSGEKFINYSCDCLVFTTEQPSCVQIPVEGDMPTAQYGQGIVVHDNCLYTIGGFSSYSSNVFRLSLKKKVWENVYTCRPDMRKEPEGRHGHEFVYDGHHIFILGGANPMSDCDLRTVPAYNLKTNTWEYFETKPDPTIPNGLPQPRKGFSCVQFDTPNGIEAYITGGQFLNAGPATTFLNDIWKINLRTMQWSAIRTAVLPRPLIFHSATTPGNGCMYIFGGIEYNGKSMPRREHLYKMWTTIPKLSEMCWDAITFYNPNLDKYNRNNLLKEGIPERFVNRVAGSVSTTKKTNPSASAPS